MTTQHVMKDLPQEVIEEILLRLPVKSLLRFRCVSKSWLSLISHPHFARLHFDRSSTHTHRILYTLAFQARSLDFNASLHDDSAVVRLAFPLSPPPVSVRIMGSCRGFLLLSLNDEENLLVWNPSTGAFKGIPQPPKGVNKYIFLCGFGYDASTDDYLIVLASFDYKASVSVTLFEIFSVKTNSWRKLEVKGLSCPYVNLLNDVIGDPRVGSLLNGAIHWLALRVYEPLLSHGVIIAFDLKEKSLQEVPMPDDFNDECCDLGVLGGCLSLIDMNYADQVEIWVMTEYRVKLSWIKLITVSLNEIPSNYFSPLCFCKGGEVVGIDGGIGLVKCSDKGELLEHREYCHDPKGFGADASVYTESLLALPSDHGEELEDRQ